MINEEQEKNTNQQNLSKKDEASALTNIGITFEESGNTTFALACYNRAVELDPNCFQAHNNKGNILLELEHYVEALSSFAKAADLKPEISHFWLKKGQAEILLGQNQNALESHKKAALLAPTHVPTNSAYGKVLIKLNHYSEASEVFRKIIELDPLCCDAYESKASCQSEVNDYLGALDSIDKALRLNPTYVNYYNKGWFLFNLKRYNEAEQMFDKTLNMNSGFISAWFFKGVINQQLKNYDYAIKMYEKTLELNPDDCDACANKAVVLHSIGNFEDAIIVHQQAIRICLGNPEKNAAALPDLYSNTGRTFISIGNKIAALQMYEKVLALKPDHQIANHNKGFILYSLGRYEEAKDVLINAVNKYEIEEANFDLMLVYFAMGSKVEAEELYNRSMMLDPCYTTACINTLISAIGYNPFSFIKDIDFPYLPLDNDNTETVDLFAQTHKQMKMDDMFKDLSLKYMPYEAANTEGASCEVSCAGGIPEYYI